MKALQEVLADKLSGRLTIRESHDPSIGGWQVYCSDGQIHFAESTIGQQERLTYLLQGYISDLEISDRQRFDLDYPYLYHLWQSNRLTFSQLRGLLSHVTQEALLHVLAVRHAQFEFEPNDCFKPLNSFLFSVPLEQLILPIRNRPNPWTLVQPEICSPFQKPFIKDWVQFHELLWLVREQCPQIHQLSNALGKNLCLYQLAHQLNLDVEDLVAGLQLLIKHGAVGLNPYLSVETPSRPVVACVDDSKTIQQFVKIALKSSGYDILSLLDPTEALPNLLEHQPALILMDIEMPKMNGYELCQKLRQHESLRGIPIVMLTRKEGIIDRIRARMTGAIAYLNKPFNFHELLTLVQQLPSIGYVEQLPQPQST